MKSVWLLGMVVAGLVASETYAGAMGPTRSTWSWVGALSAGPVWENAGTKQAFYENTDILKGYVPNNSLNTVGDFELFGGVQYAPSSLFFGQLGLALAGTTDASLSGMIWDDDNPEFNNLAYQYKIQHTHVALKGLFLADMGYWVIPWLSASVGAGFNTSHAYTNHPLIEESIANPNFRPATETAFTYTVGTGIQRALTQHWQVGAGYEFADWGKVQLNRAEGQTLNSGLKLNHLYTNGIMFNLTYVS